MNLTNSELLLRLKQLSAADRKLTVDLIAHLEELDRRKLHLDLGFKNLYDYCVRELEMSEGSAHLRISAMRLAREAPAVIQSIESGKLTLTNAAQVHRFVKIEKSQGRTVHAGTVAKEVEGMSTRQCERKLADANPTFAPQEKERVLSGEETQITFVASQALLAQLEQLREEWSHVNPHFTFAELFARMAEVALRRPQARKALAEKVLQPASAAVSISTPNPAEKRKVTSAPEATQTVGDRPELFAAEQRGPGAALRRAVLARDRGCVQCGSRFQLEIDHVQPWAHGGKTELTNLQTLCGSKHPSMRVRSTPVGPRSQVQ